MRILLVNTAHPALVRGGAEAAVWDLARKLVERGHSVALVTHHPSWRNTLTEEDGIRHYRLGNRNLYYAFRPQRAPTPFRFLWHWLDSDNPLMGYAFRRILDREKPDIVNTHVLVGLSQGIWRTVKTRGIALVHYLHEYGVLCPRGSTFRNDSACRQPCKGCIFLTRKRQQLSMHVDTVIGVSDYTLQRHLEWGAFAGAHREVLPNIFEGLAFHGRAPARIGPMRIGYFGRLVPDKGAHLLIEAVKRLPQSGWTLDIAGTGDSAYIESLKKQAGANVRFLGWRKPQEVFSSLDMLVLPSLWPDPQPRVTFEAYMYGVPVIGSTAGGIPEEIWEGRTGWLFPAGSVQGLADILMERLHNRDDQSLPGIGFEERLNLMAPDRVIPRYEQVFSETLERVHNRVLMQGLSVKRSDVYETM
jgi:glycosyltransferase involved in cell wall biosynthesis